MRREDHIPIRTCIGCRKKRKKEEMIWLAPRPEGIVAVNPKEPHRGRGLYVCPDQGCLNMAKKKNRGVSFLGDDGSPISFGKGFFPQEVRDGKK